MKRKLCLLIIDPQNDFCDLPESYLPMHCQPALPIAGAHADMLRLAELLSHGGGGLSDIIISLDAHHHLDIAHSTFWHEKTAAGEILPVAPFTQITAADVRARRYIPRNARFLEPVLSYLDTLESKNHYQLMIWPNHCEIGTWGQNIHADIRRAYNQWEVTQQKTVTKLLKGEQLLTEHYSIVQAEVPDPAVFTTQTNQALLQQLQQTDQIYIAGEASSHCVKASVEDLLKYLPHAAEKIVLVYDCMSPVAGFEKQTQDFFEKMQYCGLRLLRAVDVLQDWWANAKQPCA